MRRLEQRAAHRARVAEQALVEQQSLVRHLVHRVEAAEEGIAVWRRKYWEEHGGAAAPQAERARMEVEGAEEIGVRVLRGELAALEDRHQCLRNVCDRLGKVIGGCKTCRGRWEEQQAAREAGLEKRRAEREARKRTGGRGGGVGQHVTE